MTNIGPKFIEAVDHGTMLQVGRLETLTDLSPPSTVVTVAQLKAVGVDCGLGTLVIPADKAHDGEEKRLVGEITVVNGDWRGSFKTGPNTIQNRALNDDDGFYFFQGGQFDPYDQARLVNVEKRAGFEAETRAMADNAPAYFAISKGSFVNAAIFRVVDGAETYSDAFGNVVRHETLQSAAANPARVTINREGSADSARVFDLMGISIAEGVLPTEITPAGYHIHGIDKAVGGHVDEDFARFIGNTEVMPIHKVQLVEAVSPEGQLQVQEIDLTAG